MIVMGLNGWSERGHDAGASLIINGELIFSIEEEKIIRQRYAFDCLPTESIKACLDYAKLKLDDIDAFYVGWDYEGLFALINQSFLSKQEVANAFFGSNKYGDKIHYVPHHVAHAYSTFIPSGYDEALTVIIDGQGEEMGTTVYLANRKKHSMELLYESKVSLGYFYSAVTKHIGMHVGEEGKTMGLASYGKPVYYDLLKQHINFENGKINCSFSVEKTSKDEEDKTFEVWERIFNDILPKREGEIPKIDSSIEPYANLAASAQKLVESISRGLVEHYAKKHSINNVCIAGGVGLNCPINSNIEGISPNMNVFVQPAANDGGISLGAAYFGAIEQGDEIVKRSFIPYLGNEFDNDAIYESIKKHNYRCEYRDDIEIAVSELLLNDNIVAVFEGRLEFGPRALGNRSLLGNPCTEKMFKKMNTLKGRELWRPLAPVVLFEEQSEWFNSDKFSPYMIKNYGVVQKEKIVAVTHVDNTARVQSVTLEYNKFLYNVLKEFKRLTGVGVLINTSFNVKGEPIVCTPDEAIDSFERMNLDYLCIGNYIIKKGDLL